ncbi:MAG: fibronectin type III-like domain-contianing protein, partial [Lachnospiraceae bacterium]
VASIARPTKQLLGFVRVGLGIGETKEVSFEIDLKQLAFHDLNMDLVVEPGDMEIYIGESSQDIRLQKKFKIIGDKLMVERKVFSSIVSVI